MQTLIGVIGGGDASEKEYETAVEVGGEIARRGYTLVCGGLGGVMEAACRGAKSQGGLTIGIIPGTNRQEANKFVDIPVVTGLSHARNIIVVRSSCAIIAIGGSYGTLSEIAYALRLDVPVVGIGSWEVSSDIVQTQSAAQAVEMAIGLAGNTG